MAKPKFKVGDLVGKKGYYNQKIVYVGIESYVTEMTRDSRVINDYINFNSQDEWSIKEPEVTVTRESLAKAWDSTETGAPSHVSTIFKLLCEKLGL